MAEKLAIAGKSASSEKKTSGSTTIGSEKLAA